MEEKILMDLLYQSMQDSAGGGASLIGASFIAGYARRSITTGGYAESGQGGSPANWQIDEAQERLIEEWARAKGLWFEHSESIIEKNGKPQHYDDW